MACHLQISNQTKDLNSEASEKNTAFSVLQEAEGSRERISSQGSFTHTRITQTLFVQILEEEHGTHLSSLALAMLELDLPGHVEHTIGRIV